MSGNESSKIFPPKQTPLHRGNNRLPVFECAEFNGAVNSLGTINLSGDVPEIYRRRWLRINRETFRKCKPHETVPYCYIYECISQRSRIVRMQRVQRWRRRSSSGSCDGARIISTAANDSFSLDFSLSRVLEFAPAAKRTRTMKIDLLRRSRAGCLMIEKYLSDLCCPGR